MPVLKTTSPATARPPPKPVPRQMVPSASSRRQRATFGMQSSCSGVLDFKTDGRQMMQGKRALVVDDSKSARVVLSRMLEKYGIEVDSAESAETALEYLKDHHPDVIFMDHLMPGMDGLQAVREIKAKPELSSIPIMMYTSQEGEIYGGEARASGAVGVLPKSIRPIDVTKALYQLQLLPDRRDGEPSALESIGGPPPRGGGTPG